MPISNILICGNYGATNIGDEAILEGMVVLLKKAFPTAEITVMSHHPLETEKLHMLPSVPLFPSGFRSFVRSFFQKNSLTQNALLKADLFVLGGGGLFVDEKLRSVPIWFLQAFHAFRKKKPIICFAQSVGPLNTFLGRLLAKKVFSKASITTVRDSGSLQVLHDLGITKTHLLADPAFALSEKTFVSPGNSESAHQPYVFISLRPWLLKKQHNQSENLAQMIDWIYEKYGFSSYLYPFQTLLDDDTKILEDIFKKVSNQKAVQLLKYSADYKDALHFIEKARIVLGMRLHSLIFATLTATPFLGLSYSSKVSGLLKDMEMSEYMVEWDNFSLKDLQERFDILMNKREQIQAHLKKQRAKLAQLAEEHVKLLQQNFNF